MIPAKQYMLKEALKIIRKAEPACNPFCLGGRNPGQEHVPLLLLFEAMQPEKWCLPSPFQPVAFFK